MPQPVIGAPNSGSTAGDVIQSIRAMIPDPVPDPADDGKFALATLLHWMNDAMRIMATAAPIVTDWGAIPSIHGMDVYNLPSTTLSIEQLWYDCGPCVRAPEYDGLGQTKTTGRSFFFGPHAVHSNPRLHVWPACDRSAATTVLGDDLTDDALTITVPAGGFTAFQSYGFLAVEHEIVLYRTLSATGTTATNLLRGQAGTIPTVHTAGAPITELNIFYKCSRLPTPLTGVDDPIEIPAGLTPLIELYALSKVRDTEQEFQVAASLRKEFQGAITALESKAPVPGIRQGLQVRADVGGPWLFGSRVIVP